MSTIEIAIWSACAGIYLCYACLTLFYATYQRSWVALQTTLFVVLVGVFALLSSGWLMALFPQFPALWHERLVLASGPTAAAVSALGLRHFLRADQRDAFVDRGLLAVVVLSAAQLLSLLWPSPVQALEGVAILSVIMSVVVFWLAFRAWLLGDRFALPMAVACAALVFAVLGMYANALGVIRNNEALQAITAALASLYVMICCQTIKDRYAEYLKMRRALSMGRDRDLLTQLWTGAALIHQVDEAIARARRNRKEMAVICLEVTNTATLRQEFGHHGMEQVIYGMAARMRQYSGSAAAVGRYSDTSFVVVFDSVKKSSVLRTLGLRLATAARRPFILNPYSTSPREFRADIGLGVARVSAGRETRQRQLRSSTQMGGSFDSFSLAQDVLHEAAELALAARQFSSRAAIVDAYSRRTVALETAGFGK
jgi:GGDEF domain-containing protein